MNDKPILSEAIRERWRCLLRVADLVGGSDFKRDVISEAINNFSSNDEDRVYQLINEKLDALESSGSIRTIKENPESSDLSFQNVSDDDFFRSMADPGMAVL